MYYHVDGTLVHKDGALAVIDCGGVGYKLNISYTTYTRLPETGQRFKLYTHLVVKDDALDLLGFYDLSEKNAFVMLTSVSGVGPKVAMNVLSSLTPERFAFAVASGDYKELSLAQGVSAKTAQKIILELKDKIAKESAALEKSGVPADFVSASAGAGGGARSDAVNALVVLGYSRVEASEALRSVDLSLPLEDIIKLALRNLMKG